MAPPFLASALGESEWQLDALAALSPEKLPCYPLERRLGRSQSLSRKGKNLAPVGNRNPAIRLIARRCKDWAIPACKCRLIYNFSWKILREGNIFKLGVSERTVSKFILGKYLWMCGPDKVQWWASVNNVLSYWVCWPLWPRGPRREMSRTLGSWVRIPLKIWMFACVYYVCV
jgi:hypothetical protein